MKTPDEIKKGLECCTTKELGCAECPYKGECISAEVPQVDALAYIRQLEQSLAEAEEERDRFMRVDAARVANIQLLESRLAQVEKERDAAVRDCARFPCFTCTERGNGDYCPQCRTTGTFRSLHEWRGVCAENSKEEN